MSQSPDSHWTHKKIFNTIMLNLNHSGFLILESSVFLNFKDDLERELETPESVFISIGFSRNSGSELTDELNKVYNLTNTISESNNDMDSTSSNAERKVEVVGKICQNEKKIITIVIHDFYSSNYSHKLIALLQSLRVNGEIQFIIELSGFINHADAGMLKKNDARVFKRKDTLEDHSVIQRLGSKYNLSNEKLKRLINISHSIDNSETFLETLLKRSFLDIPNTVTDPQFLNFIQSFFYEDHLVYLNSMDELEMDIVSFLTLLEEFTPILVVNILNLKPRIEFISRLTLFFEFSPIITKNSFDQYTLASTFKLSLGKELITDLKTSSKSRIVESAFELFFEENNYESATEILIKFHEFLFDKHYINYRNRLFENEVEIHHLKSLKDKLIRLGGEFEKEAILLDVFILDLEFQFKRASASIEILDKMNLNARQYSELEGFKSLYRFLREPTDQNIRSAERTLTQIKDIHYLKSYLISYISAYYWLTKNYKKSRELQVEYLQQHQNLRSYYTSRFDLLNLILLSYSMEFSGVVEACIKILKHVIKDKKYFTLGYVLYFYSSACYWLNKVESLSFILNLNREYRDVISPRFFIKTQLNIAKTYLLNHEIEVANEIIFKAEQVILSGENLDFIYNDWEADFFECYRINGDSKKLEMFSSTVDTRGAFPLAASIHPEVTLLLYWLRNPSEINQKLFSEYLIIQKQKTNKFFIPLLQIALILIEALKAKIDGDLQLAESLVTSTFRISKSIEEFNIYRTLGEEISDLVMQFAGDEYSRIQKITKEDEKRKTIKYSEELSEKEIKILRFTSQGLTNREIGIALGYSEISIKKYMSLIYQKLNVKNRVQAIEFVKSNQIL